MASSSPSSSLSDEEIRLKVEEILPTVDMETTGFKKFLKLLSAAVGQDLKSRKDFVKQALTEALSNQAQEDDEEEEEEAESEEEEDDDDSSVPSTPAKKKGGGGLAALKEISPQLQQFLQKGDRMARTEIVKALWEYIRQHNLQNPANKKEIILDAEMKKVFGCDTFTMFSMNKYIGAHIHPFKPVDLTTPSTPKTASRAGKKRKVSSSSKRNNNSALAKKKKSGTQPPYRLSDALAQVVGTDILPRPQVVSRIWEYIKAHNLQNPADKREILCDDKLKRVMSGKAKVTMFKMNTFIGDHLIEKVDRQEYQHEEDDDDEWWEWGCCGTIAVCVMFVVGVYHKLGVGALELLAN